MALDAEQIDRWMIAALPHPVQTKMANAYDTVRAYVNRNGYAWEDLYAATNMSFDSASNVHSAANDEITPVQALIKYAFNSDQQFAVELFWLSAFHRVCACYAEALVEKQLDKLTTPAASSVLPSNSRIELIGTARGYEDLMIRHLEYIGVGPQATRAFARMTLQAVEKNSIAL